MYLGLDVGLYGRRLHTSGAVVGGAALLSSESDGFASDFLYATDAQRVTVKAAGSNTNYTVDGFYTNLSISPKLVYNSAGTLGWTQHNLLLRSQTFNVASWSAAGTVTLTADAATAPDGTVTAEKLSALLGTSSFHSMPATVTTTVVAGANYTLSIYAKAAELSWLGIETNNTNVNLSYFDLTNGVVGNRAGIHTASSITSAGNGWYRCSVTYVPSAGAVPTFHMVAANGGGSFATTIGFGMYLWGAQLNRGSTALTYLPTTTLARCVVALDYDPATLLPRGMMGEISATNLLLNSIAVSTQDVTVTAVANTLSFSGTGTITLTGVSTAGPLVGTGANNRVSLTFTPTAGTLTLTVSGSVTNAQLEVGSTATSYIPTYAATVTRAVDNYNVTPTSINHSATAGTWWADVEMQLNTGIAQRIIGYASNTNTTAPIFTRNIGANTFSINETTALAKTVSNAAGFHKLSSAWQSGDRAITADGLSVVTDAGATANLAAPGATIGFLSMAGGNPATGYIRKLRYVPRRKTNPEMVTETT